jgi:hypothetical protein
MEPTSAVSRSIRFAPNILSASTPSFGKLGRKIHFDNNNRFFIDKIVKYQQSNKE